LERGEALVDEVVALGDELEVALELEESLLRGTKLGS
jgi:hypothetical protein